MLFFFNRRLPVGGVILITVKLKDNAHISLMQADFMKMPFDDNTFDAVYAIEATCHAPDPVIRFKLLIKLSFL